MNYTNACEDVRSLPRSYFTYMLLLAVLSAVAYIQSHAVHKSNVDATKNHPMQEFCISADGVEMVHGDEWL